MNIILPIKNMSGRPYVQGAVLVDAVTSYLRKDLITNFSMRLHKPILGYPTLHVESQPIFSNYHASGAFQIGDEKFFLGLSDSGVDCIDYLDVDEVTLTARLKVDEYTFIIDSLSTTDNPFVCWSLIERPVNLSTFGDTGKMWFLGIELTSLDFLNEPLASVGSSISCTMLSSRCVQRHIYYNQKCVGTRTALHA